MLFDLGHVSTTEPFQRLVNQGYILAPAYIDERGAYVEATEVEERDGEYFYDGKPVTREFGKMGKSLKNAVSPDDIYRDYGADTLRLYEMFMGPLDKERPWNTADIIGVHRFLQRLWRNLVDEDDRRVARAPTRRPTTRRAALLHRTIAAVRADMAALSFNTAIARLFELNNHLTTVVRRRRDAARGRGAAGADGRAARAAHRRGAVVAARPRRHAHVRAVPDRRPALLVEETVEVPVQVNGKVRARDRGRGRRRRGRARGRGARRRAHRRAARRARRCATVKVVPGRIVNFVLA